MQDREGSGASGRPGNPRYVIKFTRGKETGTSHPLTEARTTLGRKEDNTITIADIRVSGVHAEIVFEENRPVLRDLGSTNGTLLDNKKIEEIVLSDGDRITMGDTEFVVLKEGGEVKEVPQDASARMDDEVRVIHDVRPARRGAGAFILLILLLLCLGSAGYYYFFSVESKKTFVTLDAAKGNLLGPGWSFEESKGGPDLTEIWDLKSETVTYFVRTKKGARSGLYAARLSIPEGGASRAFFINPLAVNQRRQYKASAWINVKGGAMVALKASFHKKGEDGAAGDFIYVDEFVAGREKGIDYRKIEGVLFPPPEAEWMMFHIAGAGKGEILLDDVELFEISSSDLKQTGSSGGMDFFPSGGGFLVRDGDRALFLGGRILVENTAGEERLVHDSDWEGFLADGERYLYCGSESGLVRANRGLDVNAQRIEGYFQLPPLSDGNIIDVKFCFDLVGDYARHGIGILNGEDYGLYGASFPALQADALVFGSLQDHDQVMLTFLQPVTIAGAERKDGGASIQCLFKPGIEIDFRFQLRCDFTEEKLESLSMIQQVSQAQREERYGEALDLLDQIVKKYPYNETIMDRAREYRDSILQVKHSWLSEIREGLKSAEFLNTPDLFTFLEDTCRRRLEHFPSDRDFEEALEKVVEKGSTLLDGIRDERAERFYHRARSFYESGDRDFTLAEFLKYMEEMFPGSEWTEKAMNLGKDDETGEGETTPDE